MRSLEESQLSDMLGSKLRKDKDDCYPDESDKVNSSMFYTENQ